VAKIELTPEEQRELMIGLRRGFLMMATAIAKAYGLNKEGRKDDTAA